MRPVNLLPAKYRPRGGGGADSKSSYIALGALAALVLAVGMYVMAAKSVNDTNSEIASTKAAIAQAESQAVTLQSFGDFAGIKQARLDAVKSLATVRLDWERLFRELAHVLPERVWLTTFDGSATGGQPGAGAETDAKPAVSLQGCAATHARIADLMVRLRDVHRASDVTLSTTRRADEGAEAGAAGAPAPAGGAAAGASGGGNCGPYYEFNVKVELEDAAAAVPLPTDESEEVPARLGGGE